MRKGFIAVCSALFLGLAFTSCNDDETPAPVEEQSPLVGTWKAVTLAYNTGERDMEHPFDHAVIKQGCATDYLTLKADATAELKENNKSGDNCVDEISAGNWTTTTVVLAGEDTPREIVSISENTLVLKYHFVHDRFPEVDVNVTYSRQ